MYLFEIWNIIPILDECLTDTDKRILANTCKLFTQKEITTFSPKELVSKDTADWIVVSMIGHYPEWDSVLDYMYDNDFKWLGYCEYYKWEDYCRDDPC